MNTDLKSTGLRLERLFSDWLQTPAYIALMSELSLSPCRNSRHTFLGLSSPFLHRMVRDDLRSRWQGAGPAIIVDDIAVADCVADPDDARNEFVGIVCHEFSHAIDSELLFAPDQYLPDDEYSKRLFVSSVEEPGEFYAKDYRPSVRIGHGPSWLRTVCHVGHRLMGAGHQIWWPLAVDHHYYQITPAVSYFRDLGDEPTRLADVSLRSIKNHPIPQRFLDRWQENLTDWPDA